MPHPTEDPPPEAVKRLVTEAKRTQVGLCIGCDANAHHTIWDSTNVNERDEPLLDF